MSHHPLNQFAQMLLTAKTSESIMAMDCHLHIVFWNTAAERLTGYKAREVLGRPCYDIMQGVDRFYQRFCHSRCDLAVQTESGQTISDCVLICPHRPANSLRYMVSSILLPTDDRALLVHFFHETEWISSPRPDVLPKPPALPTRGLPSFALTSREREVLALLAEGRTTRQVSGELHITYATARNHVQSILEKLGVHSRMEAVLATIAPPDDPEKSS